MVIDAHVHCTGGERTEQVLRTFDEARVDHAVLLAPFLSDGFSLDNAASLREGSAHLAQLIKGHEDRLTGFAVVNPMHAEAKADLRYAIETLGLRGLKMVPTGWYPYEPCALDMYRLAASLDIPILLHSGIFIDGVSGRFCRPTFYEALHTVPGVRATLAHLGWPWTDEANAVGLIDLIKGVPPDECAIRFDISFGAPPAYRREVLSKALAVLSAQLLQFGSDCFLPCEGSAVTARMNDVENLLDELQVAPAERARIMGGTAAAWLNLR